MLINLLESGNHAVSYENRAVLPIRECNFVPFAEASQN